MNLYELTYKIDLTNTVTLKFIYSASVAVFALDFQVEAEGIGQFQIGYDNDLDHFYPGNIDIRIIDYNRTNFNALLNLKKAYNHSQPFNHWTTFYLEIYRNSTRIFKGILDNIQDDFDSETINLTFTDATNLFRSMSFRNPAVLLSLAAANIGRISSSVDPFGYGKTFYYFGLTSLVFKANYEIETYYADDTQDIPSYNLNDFLTKCLTIFNPDISFYANIPYVFLGDGVSGTFPSLYLAFENQSSVFPGYKPHAIYSMIGRYMFVKNSIPFTIPNLDTYFEYVGTFKLSSGPEGAGNYKLYSFIQDDGILDDLSFGSFFDSVADSFSAKFGFTDYKHAFLIEKNAYQTEINTDRFLREASREYEHQPFHYISARNLFHPYQNVLSDYGEKDGNDTLEKNYSVIFDTYNAAEGINGFRGNLWLRVGTSTVFKHISTVLCYGIGGLLPLSKLVAQMHYDASLGYCLRYNLSLNGYQTLLYTYNIEYYNRILKLNPTEINYDIFQDITYLTARSNPNYT